MKIQPCCMLMSGMLILGMLVFPLCSVSAQNLKPVLILADVSGSMQDDTEGYYQNEQNQEDIAKVHVLKELLIKMMPQLSCDTGVYRVRYLSGDSEVYEQFLPLAAPDPENTTERIQKEFATDYATFNRRTPIADMLRQLDEQELGKLNGRITLLLISDGKESFYDPEAKKGPLTAIRSLKEKYGSELRLHTVFVPRKQDSDDADQKGKDLLANMARDGEGQTFSGAELLKNPEQMAALCALLCQKKVEAAPPIIAAPLPEPERPAPVVIPGGPSDADGDGVYDDKDECPDTPRGARVNIRGCWVLEGVLFAFDKWDIRPRYYQNLDEVVVILKKNLTLKAEIQGHTDNWGTAAYNEKLSRKRAESVKAYLVKKGIESERLSTSGYGFTKPVAPNTTKQGRALNRRVELKPIW